VSKQAEDRPDPSFQLSPSKGTFNGIDDVFRHQQAVADKALFPAIGDTEFLNYTIGSFKSYSYE